MDMAKISIEESVVKDALRTIEVLKARIAQLEAQPAIKQTAVAKAVATPQRAPGRTITNEFMSAALDTSEGRALAKKREADADFVRKASVVKPKGRL
jgi:hypothetical protein